MFPGQCGNTAFFFKSQPDQFHFEFRGIVFPGKSFFSAHEVSTCKISGCLSYRILDSGPDGTQTTLTIDPTWVDSSLTTILNPEAILFANPIAQGACAADAMASAFHMPLDILFWCAGSQGSMYPFSGWVSNESSPLQSSLLVSERMAYKLHRQGQIMESIGKDKAVCYEYPSPIIPKERWRYQMVNMYPDSGQCHPVGRSVMRWEAGKNPPNTRKNYGYLMWRKRNCVFL
ncbi:conjugal transfer pilus assembly protein TraU [Klebsiella pneumoniae]|nr:conjugal transfer pilus assembly protein TraU [Klebsiella pneumoniae]SLZ85441.1 conjugal transfer pilus assembly protein TraU [Klebsiella pneumoniae]